MPEAARGATDLGAGFLAALRRVEERAAHPDHGAEGETEAEEPGTSPVALLLVALAARLLGLSA